MRIPLLAASLAIVLSTEISPPTQAAIICGGRRPEVTLATEIQQADYVALVEWLEAIEIRNSEGVRNETRVQIQTDC
jgi:predicted metal-dependent hydrolase